MPPRPPSPAPADQSPPSPPPDPPATSSSPGDLAADLPGFRPPPDPPEPSSQPSQPSSLGSDAAAGDGGVPIDLEPPEPGPTQAPRTRWGAGQFPRLSLSLRRGAVDPETKKLFAEFTGKLLEILGTLLQARYASPDRFGPNNVFMPDEGDMRHIAEPAASMIARRAPGGIQGDSDAADLLSIALGTGGYAIKNIDRRRPLLRAERSGAWSGLEGPGAGGEPVGSTAPTGEHFPGAVQ